MRLFSRSFIVLAASGLIAAAAGCGRSAAYYTPSDDQARKALDAALTAWRDGKPADTLDALSPPVHAVDTQWKGGQGLESFEILREEASDATGKKFVVQLALKKPGTSKEAKFVVLGRDPVWVYREEDYARTLDMDNNPAPSRKGQRGKKR